MREKTEKVKILDNDFKYCMHRIQNGKKGNRICISDNIAASVKEAAMFLVFSFLHFLYKFEIL